MYWTNEWDDMNEISLFTGGGGGTLATRWLLGWTVIQYVENDEYCVQTIKNRISDGWFDDAPVHRDARTFDGTEFNGRCDVITAGFPCQPFSVAGAQRGENDERNLWPDTFRIICNVRPKFVLLENVPGIVISGYIGTVFGQLAEIGYDLRWTCISGADVGAPHIRNRLWILAYDTEQIMADTDRKWKRQSDRRIAEIRRWIGNGGSAMADADGIGKIRNQSKNRTGSRIGENGETNVPDADGGRPPFVSGTTSNEFVENGRTNPNERKISDTVGDGCVCAQIEIDIQKSNDIGPNDEPPVSDAEIDGERSGFCPCGPSGIRRRRPGDGDCTDGIDGCGWWENDPADAVESGLGRMDDGVADRVDRLKAIGNGQIPAVVAYAWHFLSYGL